MAFVGFVGSRGLSSRWSALVGRVVASVARAGRGVAVGCAVGGDALALRACFSGGALRVPAVRVFAAFGPGGAGSWRCSAVRLVSSVARFPSAFGWAGRGLRVVVSWWAGGGASVPLVARLRARSSALVSFVAGSGSGAGLVAFVVGGPSRSPGSWRSVRLAVAAGLPVVVFPCGCSVSCFPSLGAGRWVRAGRGVWASGWRWVPAGGPSPDSATGHTLHDSRTSYRQPSFLVEVAKPTRQLVRELPAGEQPVNRLYHHGARALNQAELLASVLQTPDALSLAYELLARFQGLAGLARASIAELCTVDGIGPAKAAQLKAALELGRRLLLAADNDKPQVKGPADVANLLMAEMEYLEQEHFKVVLLNSKNRIMAAPTIYIGTANTTYIRVAEVLKPAIRQGAVAMILVHNHPSGDPTPSPEDVAVTKQIVAAAKLVDIQVLDHIIIGQGRWTSLKERQLGFD